jgi:hypothetical protein
MIGEIGGDAEEKAAELYQGQRHQAGGGFHRRPDGASGTAHGTCRRHHQRQQRYRPEQGGGHEGQRDHVCENLAYLGDVCAETFNE